MTDMAYRFAPLAGIAIAIAASAFLLGVAALGSETSQRGTLVATE
jgi:hypothetical protein